MAYVLAEDVWKQFQLRRDRADSVGHLLLQMLPRRRRPRPEPFWALQGISFEMPEGTSLGVVGNNGSGKSTLLKILTRTMLPTRGRIATRGRISALIELGAGFHPDFTGRENVILNASILGIPRKAIERKMDAVIDFAEIRPFIDTPVKYYSSGMMARLGFSVATSVEPEILIVDEVLAVGDEAFAQKCMDRIFRMKRAGVSILLVSHDLGSVERLMDRAIWIDRGVMRAKGLPRDVVHAYRASMTQAVTDAAPAVADPASPLTLREAWVESGGEKTGQIVSGERMAVVTEWQNPGPAFTGHLSFTIRRPDGLEIAGVSSLREGTPLGFPPGVSRIAVETTELRLATGQYEVDAALHAAEGRRLAEWRPLTAFRVQAMEKAPGIIVVPHRWRVG